MAIPSSYAIALRENATSEKMNTIISWLYAAIENVDAKTADAWLLGAAHSFAGTTIQDALNENYSAIAAGLTVGSGTPEAMWCVNTDVTGTPTQNSGFGVERGTSPNVAIRWNETGDYWEMHNGAAYERVVGTSNAESLIGGMMVQPFDTVYNASLFNPHELSTSSATNVAWIATSDPTYHFPTRRLYSSQTSLNYYCFDLLIRLPTEFADWKSATAAVLYYRTETVADSQNHLDISIRHKDDILASGTSCSSATRTNQVATASGTWTILALDKSDLTNAGSVSWAAGDFLHIDIKMESKSSKYCEFGPLVLFGERT